MFLVFCILALIVGGSGYFLYVVLIEPIWSSKKAKRQREEYLIYEAAKKRASEEKQRVEDGEKFRLVSYFRDSDRIKNWHLCHKPYTDVAEVRERIRKTRTIDGIPELQSVFSHLLRVVPGVNEEILIEFLDAMSLISTTYLIEHGNISRFDVLNGIGSSFNMDSVEKFFEEKGIPITKAGIVDMQNAILWNYMVWYKHRLYENGVNLKLVCTNWREFKTDRKYRNAVYIEPENVVLLNMYRRSDQEKLRTTEYRYIFYEGRHWYELMDIATIYSIVDDYIRLRYGLEKNMED